MTVSRLILIAVSFSVMSIVAIIGNFHLLYTIATVRALQTVGNSFLFSLAVADFLVGLVVMPTTVVTSIANKWLAGDIMCSVSAFLDNVTLTMSMWSLGLLSIERYFLMVYPLRYHNYMTPTVAKILIACSWIFVIVLSALPLVGWGQYDVTETFSCGIKPQGGIHNYYFLCFCFCAFLPPISAGTFSYVKIIHLLLLRQDFKLFFSQSKSSGTNESVKSTGNHLGNDLASPSMVSISSCRTQTVTERKEILMAVLSVFLSLVLMICFNLPPVVTGVCMWAKVDVNMSKGVSLLFHIMWYLKSSVNPVILGGLNASFRILFKHHFKRVCCCEKGGLSSGATLKRTQTFNYDQSEKRKNEKLYSDAYVVNTLSS